MASFDEFWSAYPRKVGKGAARRAYEKALKVADHATIMEGLERYRDKVHGEQVEERFIVHASTFLNQERWADEYQVKQQGCDLDTKTRLRWEERYRAGKPVPRDMLRILGLGEFAT